MQENTNWYWKQQPLQQNIIVTTIKIIHPRLNVSGMKDVQYIPKTVCNIIQGKTIQRYPICLTDSDYDYILDKIKR